MGTISQPPIARLMGRENYNTWRIAVEASLQLDDLWMVIENELPTDKKDKTWTTKDQKARAKIILLVDPVNYSHVSEAKTVKEAWSNLQKAFQDSGLVRRIGLLRQLVTTQLVNLLSKYGRICR
uniref:2-succinyl-5-enolpyruvyl-6-hydroxy-3-cyclohexene-1-carboxylate synthase n=1 Tax=Lygus hesperus TaxID=30085 RepID=A0A0A9ZC96_LYGHE